MKIALLALGSLAIVLGVLATVFVVGMRAKWPRLLDAVRRTGRAMKPLALRSAGTANSPTSVVHHVGRRSGRPYETPVVAAPTEDGFVIALPYGQRADWMKNVLAAGRATVDRDGATHAVEAPELITIDEANPHFPAQEQRRHHQFKVTEALRLRSVAAR